jgi:hypothetical protein
LDLKTFLDQKEEAKDDDGLPKITFENIGFLEQNENQMEITKLSKQAMLDWLDKFLNAVDKINNFFENNLSQYIEEFITLQRKCLEKTTGIMKTRDPKQLEDD